MNLFKSGRTSPLTNVACTLGILWLTCAMLGACSSPPPGSGSIDGLDLGLKTELHLKDLSRATAPDVRALQVARELFATPPQGLDSLRAYSATAVVDEDEGMIPLTLWLMPLGDAGDGFVVLVTDGSGTVRRSRIWGNVTYDADTEGAWETYAGQYEYDESRSVIRPMRALSVSEVDSLWSRLEADTTAAAGTTRLLYEHRLIMYDNNFILRRTTAVAKGTVVPPIDWLEENREKYRRLEEMGEELRPVIGDSASIKYVNVAREAGEILELAIEDARASEGDKVRERILTFRRRACGGCHGIENHDAGQGKLKNAVFNRLEELGVRRDLYTVGRDVWGVPWQQDRSQAIADAVKAMLVAAGSN